MGRTPQPPSTLMVVYAEQRQRCRDCLREWPSLAFPVTGARRRDGSRARRRVCPDCYRRQQNSRPSRERYLATKRERYQRERQDPEILERRRRQNRESRQRRFELSAEARERQRAATRRYYHRRRASDPEWWDAGLRRRREERARLRAEDPDGYVRLLEYERRLRERRYRRDPGARGRDLERMRQTRRQRRQRSRRRPSDRAPMLPAGPLVDYLAEKVDTERRNLAVADVALDDGIVQQLVAFDVLTPEQRVCAAVARVLDIEPESVQRMLNRMRKGEHERVSLDAVDAILVEYDEPWLLDVLWPDVDELLAA